jgi:hypothetical protein
MVTVIPVGAIVLALATLRFPDLDQRWTRENGPVETATAVAFLLSAIILLMRVRSPETVLLHRITLVATVAAFLSEVSFGMGLFGWSPPVFNGLPLDAVHDVLAIAWLDFLHRGWVGRGTLAVLAVAAASLVLWQLRARGVIGTLRREYRADLPASLALAVGALCMASAVALDLPGRYPLRDHFQLSRLEEYLELGGALLILAFTVGRRAQARPVSPAVGVARFGAGE